MNVDTNTRTEIYFAFALVLLKSKPQGVSLEDYIFALRASITARNNKVLHHDGFLNGNVLWHDLFSQAHRDNLLLQTQKAFAIDQTSTCKPQTPISEPSQQKRKARVTPDSSTEATITSKRRRLEDVLSYEKDDSSVQLEDQHADRTLVLTILFRLARTPINLPLQQDHIVHLVHLACSTIILIAQSSDDTEEVLKAQYTRPLVLNEACVAAKKIWSVAITQMRSLASNDGTLLDTPALSTSICAVVSFYLKRLHQYCLHEADERIKLSGANTNDQKSSTSAVMSQESIKSELFRHNCGLITSTLAHMLVTTGSLQNLATALFEKVAAVFLHHLGSSMSLQLIADSEYAGVDVSLVSPGWVLGIPCVDIKAALLTTKIESLYLVDILRNFMQNTRSINRSLTHTESNEISPNNSFNAEIVVKLQSTLVRGIFDSEDRDNINAIEQFEAYRQMDTRETETLPEYNVHQKHWFLSQVWELLGWDILMKEDGFP